MAKNPATLMPAHIQLGALIGEGGMGEVYAAEHAEHGAAVVKLMHAHLDDRNRERLRLEAEALSKIRSRHVVRVLDWGTAGDRPFLVMERLHGHGLDVRLQRGALPVDEAVDITLDVLHALAVVHDNKLVHRDIKPANIFICPDRAVLLDFGIVKLVESVTGVRPLADPTKAGAAIGTPRYMSPEQARGTTVDRRTDFYCLGVVLFRMLTGENLFPHTEFVQQVTAHVKEAPRRPSQVLPSAAIPAALDEVVLKALAKKPEGRFADAAAFIAALEAFVLRNVPVHDLESSSETIVLKHEADAPPSSVTARSPVMVPAPSRDEASPLNPGEICGSYTIDKEIGRGGMGVVYLAHDKKGQRRAIKTLVFGGHLTEQLVERFSREMLLLSSIESPHMVRFYEAGKIERPEGTTMWIALEFLDGRTLRELIDEHPQGVEPEMVARWGRHIAEGVAAAHKLHVVHRDLKPENAALTGETVKVFDLGIAKWQLASNSTAGNLRIGTLAYMAPEQADPSMGKIDERTDIYALGLILWELAMGRHPICPFDEPLSAMEVQLRIMGMEPPSLAEARPGFPVDLAAIAMRCLHKHPDYRFASMREVIDALDEVLIRLRTQRHAAAFAELGVDAGAAHDAARKARTSSATDATPPPVVYDRQSGPPSGSSVSNSGVRSSGGFQSGQPRTHMLAPGESRIEAWKAQADAQRAARGDAPRYDAGTVKMQQVPEPTAALPPLGGHSAPAGSHPFVATAIADGQHLAHVREADALVDATALPPTEPLPSSGMHPAPAKPSGGGVKVLVAVLALAGMLGGGLFFARGMLFGGDPASEPAQPGVATTNPPAPPEPPAEATTEPTATVDEKPSTQPEPEADIPAAPAPSVSASASAPTAPPSATPRTEPFKAPPAPPPWTQPRAKPKPKGVELL